jgi:hypothetical protein
MEGLIKIWQERQVVYEKFAQKYRDTNNQACIKYNAKAQATRDCWKELLEALKTEKG